ncbi:restriction endonuclease subunit S [Butyricimonas virosa]|uniref:restriction endonuclease subunit S n=1 Tax=Butyricimonas virosa TaxID=544645 RepID=UPI0022E10776|nr:restriction endonuclease subunit S [Butyricimonas virosa]
MTKNNEHKNLNVPDLRFPEFSGEWVETELQDIVPNICSGKDRISNSGEVALYGSTGVIGRTNSASYKENIVLVARVGANAGQMQIGNAPCGVTDNTLVIDAKEWNYYIYYFLQHYNLNRLVFGSGQPLITGGMLKRIKVRYGCKAERNNITRLLCLIDERIATQNKIIEKLESLIKGIYSSILWKDYRLVSLSEIFIERNERTTTNNQYQVLSSTAKGLYRQSDYFDKEVASANNVGYKVLRLGDIVLSPQNLWLGNINYNDAFKIGIVSPSYKVFSIREGYNPYYVSCFLKTPKALYEYANASEQGASVVRRNLDVNAFMAICFPMPNRIMQDRISERVRAINMKLDIEKQVFEKLNIEKQYLLRQLFI